MSKIVKDNGLTISLRDLHIFPMTEDSDSQTNYDKAIYLGHSVSASIKPIISAISLPAEDTQLIDTSYITGYELELELTDIVPETLAKILGQKFDSKSGVTFGGQGVTPWFGLSYRAKLSTSDSAEPYWFYDTYYKVKFAPFDETRKTLNPSEAVIEPQTVKGLKCKAYARTFDDKIRYMIKETKEHKEAYKALTAKWFEAPQVAEVS